MTTSANESPEKTTSTKESPEKTTSAKESVKQKSLNIISSDSSEDEFGEPKPKSLDSLPSDSSEDRVEEPKREKKEENLPQTSTPGRKLSKRKPKSLDILPSDSSEEEFEEPKREKKKKNLPQTSTPERKLSKQVHVASDTEDMPTLNFQWKKMKKGACSTASPEQSPIKNDSLLEDLPEILVTDTDEGKCTDDWTNNENKRDDDAVLKEFEEMMQQKRERQLFAESTFIAFPAREEPQIQLWVVYESHGGLAINRPFKVDDTVKSVFSWIIQEVDPEVLPPVFHLECRTPTNCPNSNCPHIYELQNSYKVNVADLPEILYLREGYFEAEETITGFGDVLM